MPVGEHLRYAPTSPQDLLTAQKAATATALAECDALKAEKEAIAEKVPVQGLRCERRPSGSVSSVLGVHDAS